MMVRTAYRRLGSRVSTEVEARHLVGSAGKARSGWPSQTWLDEDGDDERRREKRAGRYERITWSTERPGEGERRTRESEKSAGSHGSAARRKPAFPPTNLFRSSRRPIIRQPSGWAASIELDGDDGGDGDVQAICQSGP